MYARDATRYFAHLRCKYSEKGRYDGYENRKKCISFRIFYANGCITTTK